jgi:hypothetical protein
VSTRGDFEPVAFGLIDFLPGIAPALQFEYRENALYSDKAIKAFFPDVKSVIFDSGQLGSTFNDEEILHTIEWKAQNCHTIVQLDCRILSFMGSPQMQRKRVKHIHPGWPGTTKRGTEHE